MSILRPTVTCINGRLATLTSRMNKCRVPVQCECIDCFSATQRRRWGHARPQPWPRRRRLPGARGDQFDSSGFPSRSSCPSCPLTSQSSKFPVVGETKDHFCLIEYTTDIYMYWVFTNDLLNWQRCEASSQIAFPHSFPRTAQRSSHGQWRLLNMYWNIVLLLIIGGIEQNPGPAAHKSRLLKIAHANINSITAPNRLDELHHFVCTNAIHILALSETKLDDNVHPALYSLDDFHAPITHHRNRHRGGTAIYA